MPKQSSSEKKVTPATEVNMNIHTSNSATMLHQRDYMNTYTNSAKNRMVDRLNELQTLLEVNMQINNYEGFFVGKTVRIKRVKYQLADICEIEMCPQLLPTYFKIVMKIDGGQQFIEEELRHAELTNYKLSGDHYLVKLRPPDSYKRDEHSRKIDMICSTQIRLITTVKSETIQRTQKALQNEFITPKEATQARQQIERLHKQMCDYFKYLACATKKNLFGKNHTFSDDFTRKDFLRIAKLASSKI